MPDKQHILQVVHGYNAPFFELANRYANIFDNDHYSITTVYLTGQYDQSIAESTMADQVHFFDCTTRDLKGLKLKPIQRLRGLYLQQQIHGPYQLIIAHRYKAIYICLLASISRFPTTVIGIAHAFNVMSSLSRQILAGIFRHRLYLLGVSDAVTQDIRYHCRFVPSEHIFTCHNSLDLDRLLTQQLTRQQAREQLEIPPNAFVFANVGRLHPDKDQQTLIISFAQAKHQMPNALLLIIGTGRLEDRLKQIASQNGPERSVIFVSNLPEAARYFKAFDVYVSSSDREPFGMVLIEAMAASLPIISTDCGGAPEVTGTKAALLFRPGHIEQLTQHMLQLYHCPQQELTSMGLAGFERAMRYFSLNCFKQRFWQLPVARKLG